MFSLRPFPCERAPPGLGLSCPQPDANHPARWVGALLSSPALAGCAVNDCTPSAPSAISASAGPSDRIATGDVSSKDERKRVLQQGSDDGKELTDYFTTNSLPPSHNTGHGTGAREKGRLGVTQGEEAAAPYSLSLSQITIPRRHLPLRRVFFSHSRIGTRRAPGEQKEKYAVSPLCLRTACSFLPF